jgi:arylsulfatase A-like enzyme
MPQDRPNIILFMTDQQRPDTIGALGSPHMRTPNLDRLCQEGTVFEQCYCTAPSCVPARASFFNLRYPHEIGVYHNSCRWEHSWVERLQASGYHTVNIGKMHTVPHDVPCGFDQRFVVENKDRPLHLAAKHGAFYDEWDKFLANNGQRKPSRHTYKAEHPKYETALGAYEWPLEEKYHSDVFIGSMACWFLEQRQSESPLFLQVGFPGPHPPYDPPKRVLDLYADVDFPPVNAPEEERGKQPPPQTAYRAQMVNGNHDAVRWHEHPSREQLLRLQRHYAANVTLIDEQIGRVLDVLKSGGYLDNAIVVFFADHGDCLGDHGHVQKWTMYDAVTRTPAIVWAPGRLDAGARVQDLLQQMDIAPMLLEFAGLETPPEASTISALDVAKGRRPGRKAVFAEHTADNLLRGVNHVTMVRTTDWKLVNYLDQDWGELYDLRTDPEETNNLWSLPEHADTIAELLALPDQGWQGIL